MSDTIKISDELVVTKGGDPIGNTIYKLFWIIGKDTNGNQVKIQLNWWDKCGFECFNYNDSIKEHFDEGYWDKKIIKKLVELLLLEMEINSNTQQSIKEDIKSYIKDKIFWFQRQLESDMNKDIDDMEYNI